MKADKFELGSSDQSLLVMAVIVKISAETSTLCCSTEFDWLLGVPSVQKHGKVLLGFFIDSRLPRIKSSVCKTVFTTLSNTVEIIELWVRGGSTFPPSMPRRWNKEPCSVLQRWDLNVRRHPNPPSLRDLNVPAEEDGRRSSTQPTEFSL